MTPPGLLVIISGPSGVGKQTILSRLREFWDFHFAVSVTSRTPRPGETQGDDYQFVSRSQFQEMVEQGVFLEWEEYDGQLYGTLRSEVDRPRVAGRDVVLDVEAKGAGKVMEKYPEAISVFLLPPSIEELGKRLRSRGDMSEVEISSRLALAPEQIELSQNFDYRVNSEQVDSTVEQILGILKEIRPEDISSPAGS